VLRERILFHCRPALLVVDEIDTCQSRQVGATHQRRYEKGAIILTSNRGLAEWGEIFGYTVVATRFLHHAVVIQIEARLRQHAHLAPDHLRAKALVTSPQD
jgi:DNA replication protein DnaC